MKYKKNLQDIKRNLSQKRLSENCGGILGLLIKI